MKAKKRPAGPAAGGLDDETWARLEGALQAAPAGEWAPLLGGLAPAALAEIGARIARSGWADPFPSLAESRHPAAVAVAVGGLAERSNQDAADRLAVIAEWPDVGKEQRRAARAALHRLRTRGIVPVGHAERTIDRPAPTLTGGYHAIAGLLSAVDEAGTQAARVIVERPAADVVYVSALLSPTRGLEHSRVFETGRRTARESLAEALRELPEDWVEAPGDYVLWRIREAVAISRSAGHPVSNEYQIFSVDLDRAPAPYSRPLIYDRLQPDEVVPAIPTGGRLQALLDTFPINSWVIEEEKLKDLAAEARSLAQSRIVISPVAQQERRDQLRRRAWDLALGETTVARLKRSIEETAYFFLAKGRRELAVTAAQAALTLDPAHGISVRRHPLALALVDRGLGFSSHDAPPPDVDPTTGYRRVAGGILLE